MENKRFFFTNRVLLCHKFCYVICLILKSFYLFTATLIEKWFHQLEINFYVKFEVIACLWIKKHIILSVFLYSMLSGFTYRVLRHGFCCIYNNIEFRTLIFLWKIALITSQIGKMDLQDNWRHTFLFLYCISYTVGIVIFG